MEMRPATARDGTEIRALVFGVLDEYGLAGDREGTDRDLEDIDASYTDRGGRFDVICDGRSRIVGCVGLYPIREGVVELRKMYLLPEYRGKGQGRRLLEFALEAARELGFRRVELETHSKLVEAVGLYRAYGFTPIEGEPAGTRCDRTYALDL